MKVSRACVILAAATVAAGCAGVKKTPNDSTAPASALDKMLPVDSLVVTGTLPNGFRYVIRQNGKPEDRAELRLTVNVGSVLETDEEQGLAHFAEHMAFNGTEHFSKQELIDYMESIGMRMGADLNAYTGFDETVYMLTVPTDSTEFMTKALQILEDWAHGVSFEAEEIDKERGVVIEEWRSGKGRSSACGRSRCRSCSKIPATQSGASSAKKRCSTPSSTKPCAASTTNGIVLS